MRLKLDELYVNLVMNNFFKDILLEYVLYYFGTCIEIEIYFTC